MHSNVCFLADLTIKFTPAGSEDQVLKVGHSHATPMDPFKCLATWATWATLATWDCQLVYMSQPPGSRPSRPVIDEYWPQVRSECPCTSLVALPSLRQRCRFPTFLSAKRLEEVELKQLMHHPAERLSSQVSSLIQIPIQSFSSPGQLLSCYAILNPYFRWPTWCNLHIPFAHQYLPHPFTKAGRLQYCQLLHCKQLWLWTLRDKCLPKKWIQAEGKKQVSEIIWIWKCQNGDDVFRYVKIDPSGIVLVPGWCLSGTGIEEAYQTFCDKTDKTAPDQRGGCSGSKKL